MANEYEVRDPNADGSQGQKQPGLTQALWVFFSEMKTAIILLLLLAVVSVLGTVITQGASPEQYVGQYGAKAYAIIKFFGLNNAYNCGIFRTLLILVGINLSVCSINRFGTIWRRSFPDVSSYSADAVGRMKRSDTVDFQGTVEDAAGRAKASLHQRKYTVTNIDEADGVSLYASKGRLSLWGPFLTHLSLLVIFLGAIIGSLTGFTGFTSIPEDDWTETYFRDSTQAEAKLDFKVALKKFTIGHDKLGNPTSYKSDLVVYDGDKPVATKEIDVNHPLTYKGVQFFQSDYGVSGMVITITAPDGKSVHLNYDIETGSGPYGKVYEISGEPFKTIQIEGKSITVFAHDFAPDYTGAKEENMSALPLNPAAQVMINDRFPKYKGLDGWTKLGWMEVGKSSQYKGYTVTVEKVVNYTGLQVSKNPGLPIVYLGFGLLMAGVFLSFYVSHRVIRLRISQGAQTSMVNIGATSREEPEVFDADFQRLRNALN